MNIKGFEGIFEATLDEKKRLLLPSRVREQFREIARQDVAFTVTAWLEPCLAVFTPESWNRVMTPIFQNSDDILDTDLDALKRFFFGKKAEIVADKTGRILIPDPLCHYANLERDLTILGACDHLEIWSSKALREYDEKNAAGLKDIIRNVKARQLRGGPGILPSANG